MLALIGCNTIACKPTESVNFVYVLFAPFLYASQCHNCSAAFVILMKVVRVYEWCWSKTGKRKGRSKLDRDKARRKGPVILREEKKAVIFRPYKKGLISANRSLDSASNPCSSSLCRSLSFSLIPLFQHLLCS